MSDGIGPAGESDDQLRAAYGRRTPAAEAHPDEATWERLACGELTPAERVALADHVTRCAACVDVYRAVQVVIHEAGPLEGVVPPPHASNLQPARAVWGPWLGLAAAASVVLALAGLAVVRTWPTPEKTQAESDATPPAVATPSAAPAPVYLLSLDKPGVRLPADLLVMRAPGAAPQPFLDEFGKAIAPYRGDRFVEAAAALRTLAAQYPNRPEVWFYAGLSDLLADHPVEALAAFDLAGDGGAARDDLPWYRAVALERAGRADEALAAVTSICANPGPQRERACAVVRPAR